MSKIDQKYLNQLKKNLHDYHEKRIEIIQASNNALHHAKRVIFALHRDEFKEAEEKLVLVEKMLGAMRKKYKADLHIFDEGAFKAANEEYVEARLFYNFLKIGKIGKIIQVEMNGEVYLAGLCDVPGELYRYAIKCATNHDLKKIKECNDLAQDILGALIEFNLTSYLRNKFDQAKQAVHKLEIVVYELSLRNKE
ncbi:MAG TPA: hypothetical protein DEB09_03800 [Candidatus Magasanikbacteria bacterium]|nr:hypothetical protein [Candidatus Magasanikbacteria bacterium]